MDDIPTRSTAAQSLAPTPTDPLPFYTSCLVDTLGVLDAGADMPVDEADSLRTRLCEGLNLAAVEAAPHFDQPTVFQARRFVTAWMDERLASDAWPGQGAWQAHPLQSDWGEGRRAGEWFFEAVDKLEPLRPEHLPLARLALRLLSFGYSGEMREPGEKLSDLRQRLARRFGLFQPPAVFPPSLPDVSALPASCRRAGGWIAAALLAAVVVLGIVLADAVLGKRLDERLADIFPGVSVQTTKGTP